MDNPETQAILGTRVENQEKKNLQKTKTMSSTDPTNNPWINHVNTTGQYARMTAIDRALIKTKSRMLSIDGTVQQTQSWMVNATPV